MSDQGSRPKAVFYDSKNTLFDWSRFWVQAAEDIITRYDSKVDGAAFKALWHRLLISENHRTAFSEYREFTVALEESLEYAMKALGIPGGRADIRSMLDLWDQVPPFADTVPALAAQQKLARILIFSNVETRYLEMMAAKMEGFSPDFMGSMEQARCCKPSPRAYNWVLEKNGLTRDEVIYCAGPQWDAQGARALGMRTVWLNRSGETVEGVALDWEVADLHGVTEVLESFAG